MNDVFRQSLDRLSSASLPPKMVQMVNESFPRLLGAMALGLYIIFQANNRPDTLSLGSILTTLQALSEISTAFEELYLNLVNILRTLGPTRNLTTLLNLDTDVRDWRDLHGRHELKSRTHKASLSGR